jgi:trehalose 6-phosphate phosphatase
MLVRHSLPSPASLSRVPQASLFLDFDGTLVEIAPRPDTILVPPRLPALLTAVADALGGRLAIISGRSLADLRRHLGDMPLTLAGSHGGELERRGAGAETLSDAPPAGALAAARAFAARHRGVLIEPKPLGYAVHYRQAPGAEHAVRRFAEAEALEHGLAIKHGRMVAELMPRGVDKGRIVDRLMQTPPFEAGTPIFVGDDITDEDGFRCVAGGGGFGVLVGGLRETAAVARLANVAAVHRWLEAAL